MENYLAVFGFMTDVLNSTRLQIQIAVLMRETCCFSSLRNSGGCSGNTYCKTENQKSIKKIEYIFVHVWRLGMETAVYWIKRGMSGGSCGYILMVIPLIICVTLGGVSNLCELPFFFFKLKNPFYYFSHFCRSGIYTAN